MKFTKNTFAALFTAMCVAAGTFAFAACTDKPDDKEPEPKPPVVDPDTPKDKAELKDGVNEVAFTADNAKLGILYTYTAQTSGTYAFMVEGENASVKVNKTAVSEHVATLEAGGKVEFVCASATDASVTYSVYAGKATALSLGANADVTVLPANGDYALLTFNVTEAKSYDLEFASALSAAEYSVVTGGAKYDANWFNEYKAVVELAAGNHVLALTSNMTKDNIGENKVSVTVAEHQEEEVKTVSLGDNTVEANYDGVEYFFTVPETANYTFTVDATNTNIFVDVNAGNAIGIVNEEPVPSVTLSLLKDAEISVLCMTNEGDDTYNVNIVKSALASSGTLEVDGEKTFGLDSNNTATVKLQNVAAGGYSLSLFDLNDGDKVTVTIGGGSPIEATVEINRDGKTRATMLFSVDEATDELEIKIVCAAGTSVVTVTVNSYNPA